jgi:hypothetical protein
VNHQTKIKMNTDQNESWPAYAGSPMPSSFVAPPTPHVYTMQEFADWMQDEMQNLTASFMAEIKAGTLKPCACRSCVIAHASRCYIARVIRNMPTPSFEKNPDGWHDSAIRAALAMFQCEGHNGATPDAACLTVVNGFSRGQFFKACEAQGLTQEQALNELRKVDPEIDANLKEQGEPPMEVQRVNVEDLEGGRES